MYYNSIIFYSGLILGVSLTSIFIIKNNNYKFDTKFIEHCLTRNE